MPDALDTIIENAIASEPVTEEKQNTEEQPAETEVEAPAETTEEVKEATEEPKVVELTEADKVKTSMQKRINKQTAKNKAMEEELYRTKRDLEEFQASKKNDKAPNEDDFSDLDEYNEAVIKHRVDTEVKGKLEADKLSRSQKLQEEKDAITQKAFVEKENAFKVNVPDYDDIADVLAETMQDMGNTPVITTVGQVIMDSDVAPQLVYELGNNPELLQNMVGMTPVQTARELFKLELGFSKNKVTRKTLPTPIKAVGSNGNFSKELDDMDGGELLKKFNLR